MKDNKYIITFVRRGPNINKGIERMNVTASDEFNAMIKFHTKYPTAKQEQWWLDWDHAKEDAHA